MISVVVPVYNTAPFLEKVLSALQDQDYPREAREFLFVDNGSDDGGREWLESQPDLCLLDESERGSYAARNRAVGAAKGEILAFTDSDCFPSPRWLAAIDHGFSDRGVQVLMGPRLAVGRSRGARLLAEYDNRKVEMICGLQDPSPYFGYTNNMAVRRETMERYGPFDRRMRGADTMFLHRVLAGEGCDAVAWCPDMEVHHAELDSVSSYFRKARIYGESHRAFDRKGDIRPLSPAERWECYRRSVSPAHPLEAVWLLALLVRGSLAWRLGGGRL